MGLADDMIDSNYEQNLPISGLKKVVSDLMEGSDIEGALLVNGKDTIVVSEFPEEKNYRRDLPAILSMLERYSCCASGELPNDMFTHSILDYNASKILAKQLNNNLTLLVVLSKQGYTGLAMLDIENSIRRIDEIVKGCAT